MSSPGTHDLPCPKTKTKTRWLIPNFLSSLASLSSSAKNLPKACVDLSLSKIISFCRKPNSIAEAWAVYIHCSPCSRFGRFSSLKTVFATIMTRLLFGLNASASFLMASISSMVLSGIYAGVFYSTCCWSLNGSNSGELKDSFSYPSSPTNGGWASSGPGWMA